MWVELTLIALLPAVLIADEFYDSRYDNFDVGPLIENDRILLSYAKCFLEKGPCTPEGKEFKKRIAEALESSCGKCSPKQRELIKRVVRAIVERHPDVWRELVDKYDTKGEHKNTIQQFLKD